MLFVCSFPIYMSALLISAHLYRSGFVVLAIISLFVPLLLFSKNHWVPRIITVFLLLAAAEWIRAMVGFILQYQASGVSWTRLAIILTSVSLFTAFSALVFKASVLKKRYP